MPRIRLAMCLCATHLCMYVLCVYVRRTYVCMCYVSMCDAPMYVCAMCLCARHIRAICARHICASLCDLSCDIASLMRGTYESNARHICASLCHIRMHSNRLYTCIRIVKADTEAFLLICLYECIGIVTADTVDNYGSDYDSDMIHICLDDSLDVLRAPKCILRCDIVMTLMEFSNDTNVISVL